MATEVVVFEKALASRFRQIESLLPERMDAARFCRMAAGWLDKNDDLRKCTPQSFALAVMGAAELGLEPILGQVYIVPYGSKATLQIGYRGLLTLVRRAGQVKDVWAETVAEGDEFTVLHGTDRSLTHRKIAPDTAPLTHAYAVARLKGVEAPSFHVMTRAEIEKRRKCGKGSDGASSPWRQWEREMWLKTALKGLCRTLDMSTELALAIEQDSRGEMGEQPQITRERVNPESLFPWESGKVIDAAPVETPVGEAMDGGADDGEGQP